MALQLAVDELRGGRKMSFSGSGDNLTVTWQLQFRVETSDPAVSGFTGADVDPYDVITATGLPVVNRSIYHIDSKIIPFVICRDKSVQQNPKKLTQWTATCKYKAVLKSSSEESDNQPISPPAALTDIDPAVVPEIGEIERVLYIDKSDTPKAILTPTKRFFAEPAIERVATQTLKISQYESSITYDQMQERMLKANENTYRTHPRFDWLIVGVEAVDVDVELSGGTTTAALVTYTVAHSPLLYGWKDDRVLVDTHYIDGGVTKPFLDGGLRSQDYGFVTAAGAKKAGTTPDRVQFETQDTIDFDTFLQV